jgi:LacI family transcriptional regulator
MCPPDSLPPRPSAQARTRAPARPASQRGATLQQVADAARVHRSTASRALSPETAGLISPDVVARITETAARLGYRRDLLAASLRTSRTRLVGVLVPDFANPVFAPILAGVEAALAEHHYAMLVANAPGDASALELVEGLVARRAEGLILATAHARDRVLARCVELGLPTVLVNRSDPEGRLSAVTPDDHEGMRLAVLHLASLGHRRIGHLAGPQDVSTGLLRAEGFRSAMLEAGLTPGPIVAAAAYTREAGQAAAARLLARRGLTAIAAANDLLALGAVRALSARGLCCPDDVSITGHNDMPLVDMVQPPLTTIRISHDLIGREGARLLLERIAQPDLPPAQIRTPPELILRASTAPAGDIRGSDRIGAGRDHRGICSKSHAKRHRGTQVVGFAGF